MENQPAVQSLERAFRLIELLSHNPDGMPLMELSCTSGLHKSTVHRLLASLSQLGYVKKDESSGRYRLTLKLFELSGRVVDSIDVLGLAKAPLEQLRNATQEAVHLVIREGIEIVYIHKVESRSGSIRMFSRLGMRRPLYCTAVGKSILATMPDDEVTQIWNRSDIHAYTEHTITDLSRLFRELDQIRQCGYAFDNEGNELGVRCIGAAVRDYTGRGKAAISVSAPLARMTDERVRLLVPQLLAAAQQISTDLGFSR